MASIFKSIVSPFSYQYDSELQQDLARITQTLVWGAVIGWLAIIFFAGFEWQVPVLWSLAALAIGVFGGFLFGIPRALQGNGNSSHTGTPSPSLNRDSQQQTTGVNTNEISTPSNDTRLLVNTNIEQISDWLTKIIVGIGLVQLQNIPSFLHRLATYIARGQKDPAGFEVLALGLILYFCILGFLAGYLLTRLFLAGAFLRAAREPVIKVADYDLTLDEVTEMQQSAIEDLQDQIAQLKVLSPTERLNVTGQTIAEKIVSRGPSFRKILWVDDSPRNNGFLVDYFNKLGISTRLELTTDAGIKAAKSEKFDRIISDMSRKEGGVWKNDAGIDLIKSIRQFDPDTPILIYCSPKRADQYGQAALEAGASVVTSSETDLKAALKLDG